ncbi:uncharacterized protein YdhG (YjbR/CyaY superfamily) [Dysgonomonas alginatilytica]|uniref:Uncharacterized protein YdhG (YjbR/CyaY superfamily) n=1 Tax=Dysgonomonas alginatilytica TaxID=1605892 RepID=A0A2V3PP49_9BACT|nr:DUF1801 domain-containing protein [Dysgonomonas alginatilytica]PXV64064.1 uncharacterized protein YdhG (YjbR/CyaY superfamily) [Dysgonomonas alginatilytica]
MKSETNIPKPTTVDEYIAAASPSVKEYLVQLRNIIKQTVPQAEESISYEMPAYKLNGILIYFGGFAKHVSLFPGSEAIEVFKDELTDYKTSKGTIRFSPDKPIPITLIKKIIKFREKENLEKNKRKNQKNS